MVEGAKRQKTPNEIALTILLVALTLVFLLATVTLLPFSIYSVEVAKAGTPVTITVLVALLVCLIPTTIGGLLSAIGVAGIGRMLRANVIATSGRAVEAAGDVRRAAARQDRHDHARQPPGVGASCRRRASREQRARRRGAARLARRRDAGRHEHRRARQAEVRPARARRSTPGALTFVPFSRADAHERRRPSTAARSARARRRDPRAGSPRRAARVANEVVARVDNVARRGATPLVVAEGARVLGVIELKDIVKGGIKERFAELRRMGIKTVMITGDNRLTAAAIAAEAGVDDFLAEATPEAKLKLIREHQADGRLVAMTGDGTNDAPALAQADVAVAMNTGTQAAKEAGNMVDLDSNPTKLIEIVEIGKQLLMTRGALTTFSIANDVAKYFAIIPAAFATTYPQLDALNVMHLATPAERDPVGGDLQRADHHRADPARAAGRASTAPSAPRRLLRSNLLVYGVGGIVAAVHRHQGDRPAARRARTSPELKETRHAAHSFLPSLRMLVAAHRADRRRLSAA